MYTAVFSVLTGRLALHSTTCPQAKSQRGKAVANRVNGCTLLEARQELEAQQIEQGNPPDSFTVCKCAKSA